MSEEDGIDWSIHDDYPEDDCHCRCSEVYPSHAKAFYRTDGRRLLVSRKPCPACGRRDNLRKVSSTGDN